MPGGGWLRRKPGGGRNEDRGSDVGRQESSTQREFLVIAAVVAGRQADIDPTSCRQATGLSLQCCQCL